MPKKKPEQKRLEALRRQLYGKSPSESYKTKVSSVKSYPESYELNKVPINESKAVITLDGENFLKRDLLKIIILSALAIGAQLLLFWSLQMKLVHFSF